MAWTIRQMGDFAGWLAWGWLSPGGIPCLNPVFRLGPCGSARGPRRLSARPRSVHGPWQIGHTTGQSRPPRKRAAVAAQLQDLDVGMVGVRRALFPCTFGFNGGECGEGRDSLALVAPQCAASFLLNKHVHARKRLAELLKAEEIERGWHDHDR